MIRIFYGNDRQKAQSAIDKILGDDYEIIEAENIERADMDSIFRGTSLFGETRNILLKNLNENKGCWESFPNYLDTTHKVITIKDAEGEKIYLLRDKTYVIYEIKPPIETGRAERMVIDIDDNTPSELIIQ